MRRRGERYLLRLFLCKGSIKEVKRAEGITLDIRVSRKRGRRDLFLIPGSPFSLSLIVALFIPVISLGLGGKDEEVQEGDG